MATASATRTLVPGSELATDSKSTPQLRGRNLEILRAIARRHKESSGSYALYSCAMMLAPRPNYRRISWYHFFTRS